MPDLLTPYSTQLDDGSTLRHNPSTSITYISIWQDHGHIGACIKTTEDLHNAKTFFQDVMLWIDWKLGLYDPPQAQDIGGQQLGAEHE